MFFPIQFSDYVKPRLCVNRNLLFNRIESFCEGRDCLRNLHFRWTAFCFSVHLIFEKALSLGYVCERVACSYEDVVWIGPNINNSICCTSGH